MTDNRRFNSGTGEKSKNLRPLMRLLPLLKLYRRQAVCALLALLVASIATLTIPLAVRRVLDHGFSTENAELVNQYFLMMILVVTVMAASSSLRF